MTIPTDAELSQAYQQGYDDALRWVRDQQENTMTTWTKLPRSERAKIGTLECDVWPIGDGARYTVIDPVKMIYLAGGKCASVEWAKQVSSNFAQSIIDSQEYTFFLHSEITKEELEGKS